MPKLISTVDRLAYGKKVYRFGDDFEASEKDARLLVGIRKAKLYEGAPLAVDLPASVMNRAVAAEEPAEVVEDEAPLAQSGLYQRRDMVAESANDSPRKPGRRGRPRKSQS